PLAVLGGVRMIPATATAATAVGGEKGLSPAERSPDRGATDRRRSMATTRRSRAAVSVACGVVALLGITMRTSGQVLPLARADLACKVRLGPARRLADEDPTYESRCAVIAGIKGRFGDSITIRFRTLGNLFLPSVRRLAAGD